MIEVVEAVLRTLPRKIKVGPYDWRIVLVEGENDALGFTEWETSKISLWPDMFPSAEHAVGTVLHELLHVIYENEVTSDEEENIVLGFETGLISLFRDNPKLLTWIKRGLK